MGVSVIVAVSFKSIIYGLSVFFTGSLTRNVHFLDVLALRYLVSFLVMSLLKQFRVLKITVGLKDISGKSEKKKHIKSLLLVGLFEPVLYMFLETAGISMTTGITAGVILALSPIFACISEMLVLKEKDSFLEKVFLGIGLVGAVYITVKTETGDGRNTVLGIVLMFAAVVSGSLFSVFSRKASKHFSSWDRSYIMCMLGAVAFNGASVVRHLFVGDLRTYFLPLLQAENILPFFYLGVICSVVATTLGNYTYSKAQVSALSAFGGLSTLVTVAAGVLLANEQMFYYHYIGIALLVIRMAGVIWLRQREGKRLAAQKR